MSEYKKVTIKISYEIECILNDELYWKGATEDEMINVEIANACEDPGTFLDIGLENETYEVEIERNYQLIESGKVFDEKG